MSDFPPRRRCTQPTTPALWLVLACAVLAGPGVASATSITLQLGSSFGSTPASGPLSITFDDGGTAGSVDITMDATGLDPSLKEFVSDWYINVNADVAALTFSSVSGLAVGTVSAGNAILSGSAVAPSDILVSFQTNNKKQGRFVAGDTASFTVFGAGLTADDFLARSTGGAAGTASFVTAASVMNTGINGSGRDFVGATPEPTAALLFGVGALIVHARTRRA